MDHIPHKLRHVRLRRWAGFVGTLILIESLSLAQEPASPGAPHLSSLQGRIEAIFALNPLLQPWSIDVSIDSGRVVLTGTVPDEPLKSLAGELAWSFAGADSLENEIRVDPAALSMRSGTPWLDAYDDPTTDAAIRVLLSYSKLTRSLEISSEVSAGVATLKGRVPDDRHRTAVREIVYDTRGVVDVVDMLRLDSFPREQGLDAQGLTAPPEVLEARIRSSIAFHRRLALRKLSVEVREGACTVSGIAYTDEERELAESVVLRVAGIKSVENDILVRPGPPAILEVFEPAEEEPIDDFFPPPADPLDVPAISVTPLDGTN